jgi:hypothetical protein
VNFSPAIAGMWHDQADNDANTQWVRNYWTELHPFSAPGGYINFMDPVDQARISDNYADNHDRLAQAKKTYEPNQRSPRARSARIRADLDARGRGVRRPGPNPDDVSVCVPRCHRTDDLEKRPRPLKPYPGERFVRGHPNASADIRAAGSSPPNHRLAAARRGSEVRCPHPRYIRGSVAFGVDVIGDCGEETYEPSR